MKWSWKLGEIAGIGIFVHGTFLILVVWVLLSRLSQGWTSALLGLGFLLAVFAIIVLHELGHALTAQRFGIRTQDITLLPIGGLARMERMPEKPWQELLVALAGPAVNLLLAALLLAVILPLYGGLQGELMADQLLVQLFWVNVSLAVFNLLPAFPMDGGRALRALLAMKMDYVRATHIAANTGQAMALLFGLLGLTANPMLLFIALFVWMGASAEDSAAQTRNSISRIPLQNVMVTRFQSVSPDHTLEAVADQMITGFQEDFPVLDSGQLVGILTQSDLLAALMRQGPQTRVAEVMRTRFESAHPYDMLDQLLPRLQSTECRTLPLLLDGHLVGLVTLHNIGEWLMIDAIRKQRQNP